MPRLPINLQSLNNGLRKTRAQRTEICAGELRRIAHPKSFCVGRLPAKTAEERVWSFHLSHYSEGHALSLEAGPGLSRFRFCVLAVRFRSLTEGNPVIRKEAAHLDYIVE